MSRRPKRKASRTKKKKEMKVLGWEIENGSYNVDGSHSRSLTFDQSFRTGKEARKEWAKDTWTAHHPNYSLLRKVSQMPNGGIHKRTIESRYSYGPFTKWQMEVYVQFSSGE